MAGVDHDFRGVSYHNRPASVIIRGQPTPIHPGMPWTTLDCMMNRFATDSPRRLSTYAFALSVLLTSIMSAAAFDAGAAVPIHGWGLVDWGMTEAQVQSAYGDGVEKLPLRRNGRTEIVESLHLKNPVVINGVALAQSFAFSRSNKGLERVVLRANLSNVSTEQCQGAYRKIRQFEVDQLKAPFEEKPGLRSLHAIWHGSAADAQASLVEVTGRCLLTLVYKRPSPPNAPSDGTADPQSGEHPLTAPPPTTAPPTTAP
jgi:hypothetical protein